MASFDFNQILETANEFGSKIGPIKKLSDQTKVPPGVPILAITALGTALVVFGIGASTICNVLGFVYPAYQSFKAIEDGQEEAQWLMYWIVFGSFTLSEVFVDYLLFWVPFYYIVKLAFLFYLMLPLMGNTRGASVIYTAIFHPLLSKYSPAIDSTIEKVGEHAKRLSKSTADKDGKKK